jgi:hypothetical protein
MTDYTARPNRERFPKIYGRTAISSQAYWEAKPECSQPLSGSRIQSIRVRLLAA